MTNPTAPTVPVIPPVPGAPARVRPERPARPAKRPDIKLTAAREESRFVGPLPLAIGVIGLLATLGFAFRFGGKVEDPSYLRARSNLNVYELGRPEAEKDYDSSLYADALIDLAKVEPDSISAGPAAALVADIKFKTDEFHRRVRAREATDEAARQARVTRQDEFMDAHERALVMPIKSSPECEKEEHAHAQ